MGVAWLRTDDGGLIRSDTITRIDTDRDGVRVWALGETAAFQVAARRRSRDPQWPADFEYRLLPLLTPAESLGEGDARAVVITAELTGRSGQREWAWVLHPAPA